MYVKENGKTKMKTERNFDNDGKEEEKEVSLAFFVHKLHTNTYICADCFALFLREKRRYLHGN